MTAAPFVPKERKTVLKPDCQIGQIRFHPSGRQLAAAALDGTVRRWDSSTDTPAEWPALTGHDGWTTSVAYGADDRLVTADSWGRLTCWPAMEREPKPVWTLPAGHDGWLRRVAVHPDGGTLATCGRDHAVRIWSAKHGHKLGELPHPEDVLTLAWHPLGQTLATGDLRGVVRLWDVARREVLLTFDASPMFKIDRMQEVGGVRALAFDATGEKLYSGGAVPKTGGFVEARPLLLAFAVADGARLQEWRGSNDAEGFVHDLHVHADGFLFAVTSGQPGQGRLFCWRPGEAQPFFLTPKMANCHSLSLHPNGRLLVVSAMNANSAGNGRPNSKDKQYPANWSPLHFWDLPAT